MGSRVYITVRCPSVCLSVGLIRSPHSAAAGLLASRRYRIDRLPDAQQQPAAARRAAANAGSATLSANVETSTRTSYTHYSAPGGEAEYCDRARLSVGQCVCLSDCSLKYLQNDMTKLHQIFCACCSWPWLDPPLVALQ